MNQDPNQVKQQNNPTRKNPPSTANSAPIIHTKGGTVVHSSTLTLQFTYLNDAIQLLGPYVLFDRQLVQRIVHHEIDVDENTGVDNHLYTLAQLLKSHSLKETKPVGSPSLKKVHEAVEWLRDNIATNSPKKADMIEQFKANVTVQDVYDILYRIFDNEWLGYEDVKIFEKNGAYWIVESKPNGKTGKEVEVTNFVLRPVSKITVKNQDISRVYNEFQLIPNSKKHKPITVFLNTDNLSTVKNFQDTISLQAGIVEPRTFVPQSHMRGLSYKLTDLDWRHVEYATKKGTTVLGYERFEGDPNKYFCTPDGKVYKQDGTIADDVVFVHPKIRLEDDDESSTDMYGNMDYDPKKWPEILKFIASNFIKLNKKDVMLKIGGFFFSTIHEYNIRKVINEFPIFHVAGQPGSGKTLTVGSLAPYFGYASHTIQNFPPNTPALSKMLTVSYTIPLILDEYGGGNLEDGWDAEKMRRVHAIMKNVYIKGVERKLGRGEGGQGQFRYKMRNPLLSLGQRFIQADSVTDRTIQVIIDGSLKGTPEGDIAKRTADAFRDFEDKNFIVGYSLWSMNIDDEHVQNVVRHYLKENEKRKRELLLSISERQLSMLCAIQTGLHFFLELCKEYNLEDVVGYTQEDIYNLVVSQSKFNEEIATKASRNPLEHFLQDFATHIRTKAHISSGVYGVGQIVMAGQRRGESAKEPGKFGAKVLTEEACVYGHPFIAVKLDQLITILNTSLHNSRQVHVYSNIQPYLYSSFERAKKSGGDDLVLAPQGFKLNFSVDNSRSTGRYTIFNMKKLGELDEVFVNHEVIRKAAMGPIDYPTIESESDSEEE